MNLSSVTPVCWYQAKRGWDEGQFLQSLCNNATNYAIRPFSTSYLKAESQNVFGGFAVTTVRAHLPQEALSESIFCDNLIDVVPNKT